MRRCHGEWAKQRLNPRHRRFDPNPDYALLDGHVDRDGMGEASAVARDRHRAIQRSRATAATAAASSARNQSEHGAKQQKAEQAVTPAFATGTAARFQSKNHPKGEDKRGVGA